MPFTASHPAAVLALARWGLPGSALVIGSIAPDMPMFLQVPAVTHVAHTPLGIPTVDLAIGAVGFVVWQALFAPALVALAPRALRARLPDRVPAGLRFHCGQLNRLAGAVAALLIGTMTHVLWDSFTHDWMWGPTHIHWLAARHGRLYGWQWAQHVSDVAGLAIVVTWVVIWWRAAPARAGATVLPLPYRVLAWLAVLVPAITGFVYWLANGSAFLAVTRGGGLGIIGATAVAVSWWIRRGRSTTAAER
jgi:hypothetical protein